MKFFTHTKHTRTYTHTQLPHEELIAIFDYNFVVQYAFS